MRDLWYCSALRVMVCGAEGSSLNYRRARKLYEDESTTALLVTGHSSHPHLYFVPRPMVGRYSRRTTPWSVLCTLYTGLAGSYLGVSESFCNYNRMNTSSDMLETEPSHNHVERQPLMANGASMTGESEGMR